MGKRQVCLLSPLSLSLVLATAIRQETEIESIQIGKEKTKWPIYTDDMTVHVELRIYENLYN